MARIQLPRQQGQPTLPGSPQAQNIARPVLAKANYINGNALASAHMASARAADRMGAMGDQMTQRALQRQDRLDKAHANELFQQAMVESAKELDEKVYSLEGKDITQMGAKSQEVMTGLYDKLYAGVQSESQRAYFDDLYSTLNARTQRSVVQAQDSKEKAWSKTQYDTGTKLAIDDIARNPTGDNIMEQFRYLQGLGTSVFSSVEGPDGEMVPVEEVSAMYSRRAIEQGLDSQIATMVGEKKAAAANKLVKAYGDFRVDGKEVVSAQWVAKHTKALKTSIKSQAEQGAFQAHYFATRGFDTALEVEEYALKHGMSTRKMTSLVNMWVGHHNRVKYANQAKDTTQALELQQKLPGTTDEEYLDLEPEDRNSLQWKAWDSHGRQRLAPTRKERLADDKLQDAYLNGDIKTINDLTPFVGSASPEKLARAQSVIIKGVNTSYNSGIKNIFISADIQTNGDNRENIEEKSAARARVTTAFNDKLASTGKKLEEMTPAEITAASDEFMIEKAQVTGAWYEFDKGDDGDLTLPQLLTDYPEVDTSKITPAGEGVTPERIDEYDLRFRKEQGVVQAAKVFLQSKGIKPTDKNADTFLTNNPTYAEDYEKGGE